MGRKCPNLETVAKGDSNTGSLDCESGILPLSYRAPSTDITSNVMCGQTYIGTFIYGHLTVKVILAQSQMIFYSSKSRTLVPVSRFEFIYESSL